MAIFGIYIRFLGRTLPKTNSSPLKMMVSKLGILFQGGTFSGANLVSGRVGYQIYHIFTYTNIYIYMHFMSKQFENIPTIFLYQMILQKCVVQRIEQNSEQNNDRFWI